MPPVGALLVAVMRTLRSMSNLIVSTSRSEVSAADRADEHPDLVAHLEQQGVVADRPQHVLGEGSIRDLDRAVGRLDASRDGGSPGAPLGPPNSTDHPPSKLRRWGSLPRLPLRPGQRRAPRSGFQSGGDSEVDHYADRPLADFREVPVGVGRDDEACNYVLNPQMPGRAKTAEGERRGIQGVIASALGGRGEFRRGATHGRQPVHGARTPGGQGRRAEAGGRGGRSRLRQQPEQPARPKRRVGAFGFDFVNQR